MQIANTYARLLEVHPILETAFAQCFSRTPNIFAQFGVMTANYPGDPVQGLYEESWFARGAGSRSGSQGSKS